MNFFGRVEQNLQHGNISVSVDAPRNISSQDQSILIKVTLNNSAKEARTINKVVAKVQANENNSGYGIALNNAVQIGNTTDNAEYYDMQVKTVAETSSNDPIVLLPNESKTIELNLPIKGLPLKGQVEHYKYELHVNAQVEGIDLDPKAHQKVQII